MITQNFVKTLKKDQGYINWKNQFYHYVHKKDRTPQPLHYYLIYDIDDEKYAIKSEYETNFNMIVLQTAIIPSKKDINMDITIKDYIYKNDK